MTDYRSRPSQSSGFEAYGGKLWHIGKAMPVTGITGEKSTYSTPRPGKWTWKPTNGGLEDDFPMIFLFKGVWFSGSMLVFGGVLEVLAGYRVWFDLANENWKTWHVGTPQGILNFSSLKRENLETKRHAHQLQVVLVPSLKPPPKHIKKNLATSLCTSNSKLPITLPSAWVQVLPALRNTKISPGMASKTSSKGARESAQPMIAVWGAWPSWNSRRLERPAKWTEFQKHWRNKKKNSGNFYEKNFWKMVAGTLFWFKKKTSSPLPVLHQGLAHFLCDVASHCSIRHEARIALLQESQGFLRGNELLGLKNHCFL